MPCCSAGYVSLVVTSLFETVCTGEQVSRPLEKLALSVSSSELLTEL